MSAFAVDNSGVCYGCQLADRLKWCPAIQGKCRHDNNPSEKSKKQNKGVDKKATEKDMLTNE